jgi:hypothetical protein
MGVMPSWTVLLLFVALFPWTTVTIVMISRRRCSATCLWIHVLTAELLATFKTPGSATAVANLKGVAARW